MDKVDIARALANGALDRFGSSGVMGKACANMDIAYIIVEMLSESEGEYLRMKDIHQYIHDRHETWHITAQKVTSILNILVTAGIVKKTIVKNASAALPNGKIFRVKTHISLFSI